LAIVDFVMKDANRVNAICVGDDAENGFFGRLLGGCTKSARPNHAYPKDDKVGPQGGIA
jgi:hypothetical protein